MKNYHSDDWIMNKLKKHYDIALADFQEKRILGIFCRGSQNYLMDCENSDVDSVVIVFPSLLDIIYNAKPVSTTKITEDNEHIEYKDIRLMFKVFKKRNPVNIEILYTKYKIINPIYLELWNNFLINKEYIAKGDLLLTASGLFGMAKRLYNQCQSNQKALSHLYRIFLFMRKLYVLNLSYSVCLIGNETAKKLKIEPLPTATTLKTAKTLLGKIEQCYKIAYKNQEINDSDIIIDKYLFKFMEFYLKGEINEWK
jgi:hypothetical protein